jgi:starvation-inducible DNA-binding protein
MITKTKTRQALRTKHRPENPAQTQLDNGMAKAKPVKPGWTADQSRHIIEALNQTLANYTVHYQKLRNYHWNVKGSDFFDLHVEFESQYREANENIDQIAERIRFFVGTPFSTLKEYLEISEIKETGSDLAAELMVRELLSDYRLLLEYMYGVVRLASEENDSGTEQMIKGFIKSIEKHHWMLTAFLAK